MTSKYGYHCPHCQRRLWTTRRAPRCCGRMMRIDNDPRMIINEEALQAPAQPQAAHPGLHFTGEFDREGRGVWAAKGHENAQKT